ncbi:MAG: hydrogenase iron-sulfur subunit [Dehalococcoidia bacterium]|nr:hydrogenase iron-sulfur subunit [Dehalococcoidia bacterium]
MKLEKETKAGFEPKILGFLCNWCGYAGADLAGVTRIQYPTNIRVIRVLCSARVNSLFILKALAEGIDGVLVCGCHPGECYYIKGNYYTRRRVTAVKSLLSNLGLSSERVRLEWVSASEGAKFANVIDDFTKTIKRLGPNPLKAT